MPNLRKIPFIALFLLLHTVTYAQISASFTASPTAACPGETINFDGSASSGYTLSSSTWEWDFGDRSSKSYNKTYASRVYSAPGTYTVTLTIRDGAASGSTTRTVIIRDTPIVDFSATPVTGCAPLNVVYTNNTNNQSSTTFTWYLGGGASPGSSSLAAPSVVYNSGPNTVTLVATNSWGCQGRKTRPAYISLYPKPDPSFTASPADNCSSPAAVTFSTTPGSTPPYTYDWYFGDFTSTLNGGSSTSHTYTGGPGSQYSPKLVVTDGNGCKDSLTKNNYVNIHNVQVSISSAAGVCEGVPIITTATGTPAGGTYSWSFGSTNAAPSPVFYTSGAQTVTVTYTYRGCSATATKTINVFPKPVADFVIDPDTLCPAPVTTKFIANASYASYLWDFGDFTGTSGAASPTHTYTLNGYYTPTLIVTSADGCRDTVSKEHYVQIHDFFIEDTSDVQEGCAPLTVHFADSAFTTIPNNTKRRYPYPITAWNWNFGDGIGTSTLERPTYVYTQPGIYRVLLTATTAAGCTATDSMYIKVGTKPDANFTEDNTHICNNKCIHFTDLSTGIVTEWDWYFELGVSKFKDPTFCYSQPGIYSVRLIAGYNGCKDTLIKQQYITVDSPWALMETKPDCDTATKVYFTNRSQGFTWHKWYFGDGGESTDMNPVHKYAALGTYDIMLVTFNSRTNCYDTTRKTMALVNRAITLTASKLAVCKNGKVRFSSTMAGSTPVEFNWYVNDVQVGDSMDNFTYTFLDTGHYKIKVVTKDIYGCRDSIVRVDYILVSKPYVAFTASPLVGCVPLNVSFTDNSKITSGASISNRMWYFGNGNASTASPTITNLYPGRGKFDIKLVVTDNIGCKDSLIKTQYVEAKKPVAGAMIPDTVCADAETTFTNTSSDYKTSAWDFGDGQQSKDNSPKHTYAKGTYNITLIVTDDIGCKDTLVKQNIRAVRPDADIAVSDSLAVCAPLAVKFINNIPSDPTQKYAWDLGNGNKSTLHKAKDDVYTAPGLYVITYMVTDRHGCKAYDTATVRVLGYAGAFTYAPLEGCNPLTVNFDATTLNVSSMTWDFSDGTTLKTTQSKVTHTYTHPGAYLPKLVVEGNGGCRAVSPGSDTIKVDAVEANFIPDAPCQFSDVTFVDTSVSYFSEKKKWIWTFHDGEVVNKKSPTKYYGPPGTYTVKLYIENMRGCVDSVTKEITIYPPPAINAGGDTIICLTDSAHLSATGGVSYVWNTTPYLSCLNCPDPYAYPKEAFNFVVTGKDEHNCTNKDTVQVKIKTKVTAITGGDKEICQRDSVQLLVEGGKGYIWTPPSGLSNSHSAVPVASPNGTTKYMVVAYEGRCIPDTDFVNVTVHPLPTVNATGENTIIAGSSTTIQATGTLINRFKWTPSESLSCDDCPVSTASPMKTTDYVVKVYTDHGCVDSDIVRITVLCDKSQLFIPNTFTPNGDGQNDVFYPRGSGLDKIRSFRIYNRWGEMVYERNGITINDANVGWDGTFKGQVLPPDVFVYVVEAICEDGQTISWKGDVTIVR